MALDIAMVENAPTPHRKVADREENSGCKAKNGCVRCERGLKVGCR